MTAGGPPLVDDVTTGPLSIAYDATSANGSPALVSFIGGRQQREYNKLSVSGELVQSGHKIKLFHIMVNAELKVGLRARRFGSRFVLFSCTYLYFSESESIPLESLLLGLDYSS